MDAEAVRAELRGLAMKELRGRAKAGGASAEQLEAAAECEEQREALVELVLELLAEAAAAALLVTAPMGKPLRAHSGSGQSFRKLPQRASGGLSAIPNGKHAMLSYQWCVFVVACRCVVFVLAG